MNCRHCRQPLPVEGMICPFCHEPLYCAVIKTEVIYKSSDNPAGIVLPMQLENFGREPYVLASVNWGQFLHQAPPIEVGIGESVEFKLPVPQALNYGTYPLTLEVKIQGKVEVLPLEPLAAQVSILAIPHLEVSGQVDLKPSRQFIAPLTVTLTNARDTRVEIAAVEVQGADGKVLAYANPNLRLGRVNGLVESGDISLSFPWEEVSRLQPGEHLANIRLLGPDGMELLAQPLLLGRYQLPDIILEYGKWDEERCSFTELGEGQAIFWRAPADLPIRKRLSLRTKTDSTHQEWYDRNLKVEVEAQEAHPEPDKIEFVQQEYFYLKIPPMSAHQIQAQRGAPHDEFFYQSGSLTLNTTQSPRKYSIQLERFISGVSDWPISLDFGTTSCCVALVKPDDRGEFKELARLHTVPLDYSIPTDMLPSVVRRATDRVSVGRDALRIPGPKDFDPIKTQLFFAQDEYQRERYREEARLVMSTCLQRSLEWLVDRPRVREVLFNHVILAVPTAFPLQWKETLRDICLEASGEVFGANKVSIIEESMAAINSYLLRDNPSKEILENMDLLVVCDFGGGSTDITILENVKEQPQQRFIPRLHGGMRNFAGCQVDKLVQGFIAAKLHQEIDTDFAERIKRSLHTPDQFAQCLVEMRITNAAEHRKCLRDIREEIHLELKNRFMGCFKPLLQRVGRRLGCRLDAPPQVLLLLAGNGSRLIGFEACLREAWHQVVTEEAIPLNLVETQRVNDPKRCVALGGFLSYSHFPAGAPVQLQNTVPEDILMGVPPGFIPPDQDRLIRIASLPYYVLFEAGEPLDKNHQASVTIPAVSLGLTMAQGEVSFRIFSMLPGDSPLIYGNLSCRPLAGQKVVNFVFTYSTTSVDRLLNVKSH